MKKTALTTKQLVTIVCAASVSWTYAASAQGQQLNPDPSAWLTPSDTESSTLNLKSLSMPNPLPISSPASTSAAPTTEATAEPTPAPAPATTTPAPWIKPDHRYTFESLGARYPFNLRGIDGSDSVLFNVRADELVTRAAVDLLYSYSPALLSDYSHINVLVNNEVAHSIPVPRDESGKALQKKIELPAHLFTEFNQLRFQLIGHYTLECEDPLHSSLWANISNKSTLSLDVQNIVLPNELSKLPLPFFDRRDNRRLNLPIVFANDRSEASLEAAGMVASWFGILAGYRGATFPTHAGGSYPEKGNAVVIMKSDPSSALPTVSGPTLAITANPNDANGKLLWIMGRNEQEIKQAAQVLVTGANTLTGQAATIQQFKQLEPRKPYDAPYWVRTDRPVKLGELVPENRLNSIGYQGGTISIPMRLPPDLFGWREAPVPMALKYRYSVQPGKTDSSLILNAGSQFMRSFNLPSADEMPDPNWLEKLDNSSMFPVSVDVSLPLETLLTQSELNLRFMFDYIKEGACRDIIIDNVRGRIDPESTIDFSHYPHFMPLPDLAAFGQTGFPYTRLADLSETAVVLSSNPSPQEISTYLALMGRFGDSTGYPGTHVTVKLGESGLSVNDKDLVVIAAGDQRWLDRWSQQMPAMLVGPSKRFGTSDLVFKSVDWKTPDPRNTQSPIRTELSYDSNGEIAFVAGFESPAAAGRSVVLISSSQPAGQTLATEALTSPEVMQQQLRGSLAVIHQNGVTPLASEYSYSIGKLSFWRDLQWQLANYWPGLLSYWWVGVLCLLVVLVCFIAICKRLFRRIAPRKE